VCGWQTRCDETAVVDEADRAGEVVEVVEVRDTEVWAEAEAEAEADGGEVRTNVGCEGGGARGAKKSIGE